MADAETVAPAEGRSLLSRLGLNRPELRAWAMYDWANFPVGSGVPTGSTVRSAPVTC